MAAKEKKPLSRVVNGPGDRNKDVKKWEFDEVVPGNPQRESTRKRTFVPDTRFNKNEVAALPAHEEAKIEAANMVRIAKIKAEQIEKEAYEQGFKQGEKAGLGLGQKKVDPLIRQFAANLKELAHLKEIFWERCHQEIVQLIFALSKKIIQHEVTLNQGIVFKVIQSAISEAVNREEIRVRINSDDYEFALQSRPELLKLFDDIKTLHFEMDNTISQGGCIIETQFGEVDARLDRQLEELHRIFNDQVGPLSP